MLSSVADIRARVKLFTDATSDPVLGEEDIDTLLTMASRVDLFGSTPDNYVEWTPDTPVAVGETIVPVAKPGDAFISLIRNGFYYTCTVAGKTGHVEPVWPLTAGNVADGTATWAYTGVAPWNPTYDVYYAIAQGWLLKAGRLVGHYNFMTGGKMLSREQFYNHCMKQYRLFSSKSGPKAIRLGMHEALALRPGLSPTNADG